MHLRFIIDIGANPRDGALFLNVVREGTCDRVGGDCINFGDRRWEMVFVVASFPRALLAHLNVVDNSSICNEAGAWEYVAYQVVNQNFVQVVEQIVEDHRCGILSDKLRTKWENRQR